MTINAWLKQIHIRGCDQTDIITGQTPLWCWGLGLVTRHGWTSGPSCLATLSSQMGKWIVSTLRPDQPPPHYTETLNVF